MSYQHITRDERVKIEAWKEAGESNGDIARLLGRNCSTIGRELKRNGKQYTALNAERRRVAVRRVVNRTHRKIVDGSALETTIERGLRAYWSPEQIAGRMKNEDPDGETVCYETIYRYIYQQRPELKKYLRCRKGKYRRRYGTNKREKQREEAKKKRIDVRPQIIEKRIRLGDWEGDTIVGAERSTHILTHVDRTSGFLLADKVGQATAKEVRTITTRRFKKLPKKKRWTITYDNGVQFAEHETLERDLMIHVYFAYPYHSWERGTNENTNGLLRQFFPKKSAFTDVTQQKINRVVKLINTRPRKRLNYRTPQEVFLEGVAI